MSHNSFGHLFRVTTWGESHGPALGCVVDGCPPGLSLNEADVQRWLDLRKPGSSRFVTQRREPDAVRILSGVFEDARTGGPVTTGTPISMMIENLDQRSKDYGAIARRVPPGPCRLHLCRQVRRARLSRGRSGFGARDGGAGRGWRCGAQGAGRGRGDPCRPGPARPAPHRPHALGLGGNVAQSVLVPGRHNRRPVGGLSGRGAQDGLLHRRDRGSQAEGAPPGWGAPIYGKLDAELAGAMMSINAVKGVEIGDGFAAVALSGEQNADEMRAGVDGPRSAPTMPGACLAASPPASRSWRVWR